MENSIIFLVSWIVLSVLLLLISAIPGSQIILGNSKIAGSMAAVVWALVFTFLCKISPQVLSRLELKIKDDRFSIVISSLLIIPTIWVIKRLALYTGLGISNNIFVVLISIMVSIVSFYVVKISSTYLKKIQ